jgi:hypothetical protein
VLFRYHNAGFFQYRIEFDGIIVADSGIVTGPGQLSFDKNTNTEYGYLFIQAF